MRREPLTCAPILCSVRALRVVDTTAAVAGVVVTACPTNGSSTQKRIQIAGANIFRITSVECRGIVAGIVEVLVHVNFAAIGPRVAKEPTEK